MIESLPLNKISSKNLVNIDDIVPIKARRIYDPDDNETSYVEIFIKDSKKWDVFVLSNKFCIIRTKSIIKSIYSNIYEKDLKYFYSSGVIQVLLKRVKPVLIQTKVDNINLRNYLREIFGIQVSKTIETVELTVLNSYNGSTSVLITKAYLMSIISYDNKLITVPPIDIFLRKDPIKIRHSVRESFTLDADPIKLTYKEDISKYKNILVSNIEPIIKPIVGIRSYKDITYVDEGNMNLAEFIVLYSIHESNVHHRIRVLSRIKKTLTNGGII